MIDLKTSYAGLQLDNPIIVSASGLTGELEKVKRVAEQGPGAIVLKSLFEEQITVDSNRMIEDNAYPEATDYIRSYSKTYTVETYLDLIEQSKKAIRQPVIASINCTSNKDWTAFARQIQNAGADALELNIYILPVDGENPVKIEKKYVEILNKVRQTT